ncbi:hypothetical protein [Lysinibacillus sp. SGAir0095]|uniref:hypothetical protein n=1 Tax=Lysinibacillus sp. SGAir0095 TaxID=2070463 RepID=UPI0010CD52C1|nr:hypothetical protein [Lysinibacillus sp. SGAir0095]QCR31946.1 hypothetical protein C1N55_07050 [Lysinibacillus sp. SGAir0095]
MSYFTIELIIYDITEDYERVINEFHLLNIKAGKEAVESLLRNLEFQYIGNNDIWGFQNNNIIVIAEIVEKKVLVSNKT